MVMAALKGTRVCWLKQGGWWKEPKDDNDQFLERQLNNYITKNEIDGITYEDKDKEKADVSHEALIDEITGNEAANEFEIELNQKVEKEDDFDMIMGVPLFETPFRYWTEIASVEMMEGYQNMTTTEEQMAIYQLGFGKDDAEEEYERMTSSDDDSLPRRTWSDGVWIVTPSDFEKEQFLPHSE
jgi:hypothetical protein